MEEKKQMNLEEFKKAAGSKFLKTDRHLGALPMLWYAKMPTVDVETPACNFKVTMSVLIISQNHVLCRRIRMTLCHFKWKISRKKLKARNCIYFLQPFPENKRNYFW